MNSSMEKIREKIICHLKSDATTDPRHSSPREFWTALSRVVMGALSEHWNETDALYQSGRQAHYFSAEFLQGRSLLNNLINLGLYDVVRQAVASFGFNLEDLEEVESDPALGNGGLGRLAACFMDASATGDYPVTGYGILYQYGLFRQTIENGFQQEQPDTWMEEPYPFMIRKSKDKVRISFHDMDVWAVPYDMPITGFSSKNVNTLRLWKAEPLEPFDFAKFNAQQFDDAMDKATRTEDISRVLYPNDSSYDGKVLRVRQQYFFTSASLQNIIRRYVERHGSDFDQFAGLNVIQLNDTHPVIAIPELMRLLMTEHQLDWEGAWAVVRKTFAYTNHTILGEALEKWDISIFQFLVPELVPIIEKIDARFRQEAAKAGMGGEEINHLAPLGNGQIRMAWLATYAGFSVNGVAALHTKILKNKTLNGFYRLWPEKFSNKTNGVTPRRWLRLCNPELSGLLTELYGSEDWVMDLDRLAELKHYAQNDDVLRRLIAIKHNNKVRLADYLKTYHGIEVDPNSLFDVQVKRLHEYKRQLLNALHILDYYFLLKEHPETDLPPVTFLFAAKAAPGYFRAKAIIKLINEIARKVNRDPAVAGRIKVVFIPNYNVSKAELIFPASDVSEQISTVGMEASGTGNMKFMINGALTLGTCDGANIEIADAVGDKNHYQFGCKVQDFGPTMSFYNPQWQYHNIKGLNRVVNALVDGTFNDSGTSMFQDIYNGLLHGTNWQPADPYYVLGDFDEYRLTRLQVLEDYKDEMAWARKCWINITSSGRFSADRTIREYASDIWRIEPSELT